MRKRIVAGGSVAIALLVLDLVFLGIIAKPLFDEALATYELTNWAVLAGWPAILVPIDIAWGVALTGTTSWLSHQVVKRWA